MIVMDVIRRALLISAAVAVMMLVIEWINVQTRGALMRAIGTSPLRHYAIAVLLGATPGCFGAYAVVALYAERRVTLGAVAAAMIATSGDEMFVMLSLFPLTTFFITLGLAGLGLLAGLATDRVVRASEESPDCSGFSIHLDEDCDCFPGRAIVDHWKRPRGHRIALTTLLAVIGAAVASGAIGPGEWEAERIVLLVLFAFGMFIVVTVPDHFLDDHLWKHVVREHVPRIFLWTLAAFAVVALIQHFVDFQTLVRDNAVTVLVIASAMGIIPESGPHLVFVTLFDEGALPHSILIASMAVQDGHGTLPLLAHSRMDFLKVKVVNLLFGLAAGAILLALGR
jgi:hypothetical protein